LSEQGVNIPDERVVILDFGSQYTQLIARRIRELNVYAGIFPYNISSEEIALEKPSAIILSGGPSSIYEKNAPRISSDIFRIGVPILGICYGLYLIVDAFAGRIESTESKEYGRALINIKGKSLLFKGLKKKEQVWMSHGDKVVSLPTGFDVIGASENAEIAAIDNKSKRVYGLQFHPEVYHTINGKKIIKNFLFEICRLKKAWTMKS